MTTVTFKTNEMEETKHIVLVNEDTTVYSQGLDIKSQVNDLKIWIEKHYPHLTFVELVEDFKINGINRYSIIFETDEEVSIPADKFSLGLPTSLVMLMVKASDTSLVSLS